jgi:hypothetical protein
MSVIIFSDNDQEYFRWIHSNKLGYVVNTTRSLDPTYMVLHRADCHTISEYSGKATYGGFTEREFIKVCANDVEALREWVKQNGRPDRSFSSECQFCSPLYTWDEDEDWLD